MVAKPLRYLLALCIAAIAMTAIACNSGSDARSPESITLEEATALLRSAFDATAQKNLEALCELGGSRLSCQNAWRNSGEWQAAPGDQPVVINSRILPDQLQDNGNVSRGGRLLEVQGVDGLGHAFNIDFLVFDEGGGNLVALNPVYWTGSSVGHRSTDGSSAAFAR